MRPSEFCCIREKLGLSRRQFADILGYSGDSQQIYKTMKRYEMGKRPIPPMLARLVWLLACYNHRAGSLPEWPQDIDDLDPQPENDECDTLSA